MFVWVFKHVYDKYMMTLKIRYSLFRVGAVGFVSVLFPFLLPLGLVQVDEETR